jgi:hypothetical protein
MALQVSVHVCDGSQDAHFSGAPASGQELGRIQQLPDGFEGQAPWVGRTKCEHRAPVGQGFEPSQWTSPPNGHCPGVDDAIAARRRRQSLKYVRRSQPQTGTSSFGQSAGRKTHMPAGASHEVLLQKALSGQSVSATQVLGTCNGPASIAGMVARRTGSSPHDKAPAAANDTMRAERNADIIGAAPRTQKVPDRAP